MHFESRQRSSYRCQHRSYSGRNQGSMPQRRAKMELKSADFLVFFKTRQSRVICELERPHLEDSIQCVFASDLFVPRSLCKKRSAVSHSGAAGESISHDAGSRVDGLVSASILGTCCGTHCPMNQPQATPIISNVARPFTRILVLMVKQSVFDSGDHAPINISNTAHSTHLLLF